MSANLLQNPGKIHTFTDDLESFLHVLGWMTLRYIPATDSYESDDRRRDMVMFDEHSVRKGWLDHGGFQKCLTLHGNSYPSDRFQPHKPTPIFKLIRELSKPFKSLYGEPPTDEDRMKINIPLNPSDIKLFRLRVAIDQYDEDIEQLQSSSFFIDEMQKALDTNDWPTNDKADTNLPIAPSGRHTEKWARMKTSRLQHTHSLWESSTGLSRSSKRAASPTPEPSSKRHCGTPAASDRVSIV